MLRRQGLEGQYQDTIEINGNRRIAPTQNCINEVKNVFMILILG